MSNIYVASSWRNQLQPEIVRVLRELGHEVYDFRAEGFQWDDVDPSWRDWTPDEYRMGLRHPLAIKGYRRDLEALESCSSCVLVLPAGRSASWELGYALGQSKRTYVLMLEPQEPELMFREACILTSMDELIAMFEVRPKP